MTLNGFDIASWQAGMQPGKVPGDFVIVKVSDGTSNRANPYRTAWCQQVLAAGKLLGLYHYAERGTSWQAEADTFIREAKPYLGKATLWLDFEAGAVQNGVAWAKRWLDYVYSKTGVKPGLYTGLAVENQLGWSAVAAAGYPLWVAQYNNYNSVYGYQPRGLYGRLAHSWQFAIFQYTSSGLLSGWGKKLDLDVFYGTRADWQKLAGGKAATKKEVPAVPTTGNVITISHIPGPEIPVYDKHGKRTKAKGYTDGSKHTSKAIYLLSVGPCFYDGKVFIPVEYTHYAHAVIVNYAKGYGVMAVDRTGKQIAKSNLKFKAGSAWMWSKVVRIGKENFFQVASNVYLPAKYVQGGGYTPK